MSHLEAPCGGKRGDNRRKEAAAEEVCPRTGTTQKTRLLGEHLGKRQRNRSDNVMVVIDNGHRGEVGGWGDNPIIGGCNGDDGGDDNEQYQHGLELDGGVGYSCRSSCRINLRTYSTTKPNIHSWLVI